MSANALNIARCRPPGAMCYWGVIVSGQSEMADDTSCAFLVRRTGCELGGQKFGVRLQTLSSLRPRLCDLSL